MEDLTKLLEVGKVLGLDGQSLLDFVEKEREREDKKEREQYEREEKKEKERLEREAKKEAETIAREERQREREIRQKELEITHEENLSKLKLQLTEKEIELAEINKGANVENTGHNDFRAKLPKLPAFCEGKDNMDSYLKRYERFAENANWPKQKWATNLSALLQGKALDVYSRLSPSDAINYDTLRDALLTRYQLTEEGFRVKFRTGRQESGETAHQFLVRLATYLTRWMELGKVPETFEGLRDLVLREQFLAVSSKSLVMFLKERKIKSVSEMTELADQYMEAHGVCENIPKVILGGKPEGKPENKRSTAFYPNGSESTNQMRFLRERVCYSCGKKDHFIKDCPYKGNRKPGPTIKAAVVKLDDLSNNEDETEIQNQVESVNEDNIPKSVATCIAFTPVSSFPSVSHCNLSSRENVLRSEIPYVNILDGVIEGKDKNQMPVSSGYVGRQKVSVLRDSGCNTTIIKQSLVRGNQLEGHTQKCILADGTERVFPVARIQVDTPYFVGEVNALCMLNPVYDLVIGNIKGSRAADNPDLDWKSGNLYEIDEQVCAVETRSQRKKNEGGNTLCTPQVIEEFTKEDIVKGQMHDETLQKCKVKAGTGEKSVSKRGAVSWYVKDKDLFYRKYQYKSAEGKTVKQLLVPKGQRLTVLKLGHDSILSGHMGVRKTKEKILTNFWWPGLERDVRNYCKSCDVCQKTIAKGRVSCLPLGKMPIIDTPFSRVAVDLIGPIHPPTDSGNRFIITVVDYATRYPEAKALKKIDTETVAEALAEI